MADGRPHQIQTGDPAPAVQAPPSEPRRTGGPIMPPLMPPTQPAWKEQARASEPEVEQPVAAVEPETGTTEPGSTE